MSMMRYEPFRDLMTLREAMDQLFQESVVPSSTAARGQASNTLALDLYQTDNDVVVKASVPGVKAEDVEITVDENVLTIKGEMKEEKETKQEGYILRERRFGSFSRAVALPLAVQADKATASFKDGVLQVTLPKAEEVKPKQIRISAQ